MPTKTGSIRTKPFNKKPLVKRTSTVLCAVVILAAIIVVIYNELPLNEARKSVINTATEAATENANGNPITLDEGSTGITKASLKLESVDNKDILRVIVGEPRATDDVRYSYEWSINGQPAGNGSDSISGVKRSDKVSVRLTRFVGEKPGSYKVLTFDVHNSTPKVSVSKTPGYDGKTFTAQLSASDADGDIPTFELLHGPEGMTIDKQTGMLNWTVKDTSIGEHPIKVKITDGHGGEILYDLTATIPKGSVSVARNPSDK
ncbi:MAG TPA: putative Ig domain-containing protein [Syntrophorhabdaceae bacterium]|nr:putative Ig domain-containing protein [Syntrophorhabdaceae bacterium]